MKKILHLLALIFSTSILIGQNYYMTSPEGFGAATTGGGNAVPVTVTTYTDLKAKLKLATPQVILVSGTIDFLATELQISEVVTNKTIIGLPGAKLVNTKQTQSESGILNLKPGSSNVIIRNLIFEGPGAYDTDGRDNLTAEGCVNLWVDHCEFQDGIDGNFDIKSTSDNVTVSWCKFTYLKPATPGGPGGSADHRFSNLIGSSSTDAPADGHYSVTFQNCYWADGNKSRMPRARNAELHILNSYYDTSVSGSTALGLGGGTNNLTCYVENSNFANVGTVYSNAGTDGGTVSLQFDGCINGVSNVGTVAKPSYNYTVLPVDDVATYIPDATCGAGATLQVTVAGEISSSCDNTGGLVGSVIYDFRDGGVIAGNGGSADGKLTLGGNYSQHGDTYGLDVKVDATISIQVDGSSTIRFLGSQYSGLDVKGTATADGDLGTQVGKVTNDLSDIFDFVYSGIATTLNFTTVAATGNDLYLPTIEVIPAQAGKDFTTPEKNIVYYFDLRDQSIVPSGPSNHIEAGLFVIDAGCCNGLSLNGSQHGITFKDGNQITLQVEGNSYIRVGADQFSGGTIDISSATGAFDIASQSNNTGATFSDDNPLYVDFLYVGTAGTVVLDHSGGGTTYLPYIEISPVPYDVSLSSYVQKSGTITINGIDINLTSGATSADNASLSVSNGIVLASGKDTGWIALDLGGADPSTLSPTVSGDIASSVMNGDNLEITYADNSTDPTLYTIELYDNSYLHGITTYDFRDGTIITNGQSGDGLLTLGGTYSLHGATYGLNMKLDSQINLQVDGSSAVSFLGSQYSSLSMEGTQTTAGDLGTLSTAVATDLVDSYEFVYSEPRKTGTAPLQFKAVNPNGGSDIYLPKLDVIPAQMGAAYSTPIKNIPYYFDFRDGSIIPTTTNGQSGISKGLVEVVVGSSNAYGYNGTQHGSILKTGNQIILQVAGNSNIKIGGSIYSNGTISVSSATGSFDVSSQSGTTAGNFGNDGSTVDFLYVGTAGTVTLDFTSTVYVPYMEISPIPYNVTLTPWVQKTGTVTINGVEIGFTSGADASSNATITVSAGTVISATNEAASIQIDLGGNPLSSYTPTLTGDIASTSVNGDELTLTLSDPNSNPTSYLINITDNSAQVEAEPGVTYTYNFFDGSELPQISYSSLRYSTFITSDGILTINSNTSNEPQQFGYHDATHGGVFFPGNSFDIIVAGNAIITFIVDIYGVAADAVFEFTDENSNVLGTIAAENIGISDAFASSFSYTGPAGVVTATLKSANFPTAEVYIHGLTIENAATIEPSNGLPDVWDFGAEQLDINLYNNKLDETKINAWYDASITPGSSGNVLPSFTEGVLSWIGGSNDRLRTSNTNLTRYDENLSGVSDFTGRIYVNASAASGRYLSLTLSEDDEVTIWTLTQSAAGKIHFEYVPDPAAQNDVVDVPGTLTELHFVAKSAGTYHIYDAVDKPSYYRVMRKDATYKTLTGNVDETLASSIPNGYSIIFTNEAGKSWTSVVSSGTYTVDLPQGYTYALSLGDANGYIISNGTSLNVTDATTTHDIVVLQVELYTVSGNIIGLGSEISNLSLAYTSNPSANTIFVPEPVIDTGASTYTVQLEPNIEYTISADGVNDFDIPNNTITISASDTSADVVFANKPVYGVTIVTPGLDATQQSKLSLTFSNLNEPGYSYSFSDITTVTLRDGVYQISADGLDEYPIELALTSNLQINGVATSKTLNFDRVTNWSFDDRNIPQGTLFYKGLAFSGSISNEQAKGHLVGGAGGTIQVPLNPGEKIIVTYYYAANFSIDGGDPIITSSGSTSQLETVEYIYTGSVSGTATIIIAATTYITNIAVATIIPFSAVITVGTDKDYLTINEALYAISQMDRPNNDRVTVMIDPGNYEEMIVINSPNVTLKNAAAVPSIELTNKGVDIDESAVRITSYYGTGYNYFSQGTDNKWHEDVLTVNLANGYQLYDNKSGTTNGSYWCATVVVTANGFIAEDIILENSFNQYISQKESEDVVLTTSASPVGGTRPTTFGDTSVQDRGLGYVERAAAIGIASNTDKVILNHCRVVGRQDSFYGGGGSRVVVYKGAMMGAVDYIFGAMDAVFYKTDFVLNTSDASGDQAYITAAQQSSGRGFLMYECNVISTEPGVNTASLQGAKPGYFGRPWLATTSEVVFYNTNIDMSTYTGFEGKSLIVPLGWQNTLGGESPKMYEYGTIENSGEDNSASRASWSTLLTEPILTDGTEITTFNFTKGNDGWDPIPLLDAEEDSDYDGIPDVNDNCPEVANPDQADFNNNDIGDTCEDSDGDGLVDSEDNCPDSPEGAVIDVFGCEVFELPSDNFSILATAVSCNGQNDGSISITAQNTEYTYLVTVDGAGSTNFTSSTLIEGLAGGTYHVCITIDGRDNYEQCFNVTVEGPTPLDAYSVINYTDNVVILTLSGAESYHINHNGEVMTTSKSLVEIELKVGNNTIEVSTDSDCQGTYFENIFISEKVAVFPNPTKGSLQVYVNGSDTKVDLSLFDVLGKQYISSTKEVSSNRTIDLDITNLSEGVYFLLLNSETVRESIKIIKN